MLQGAGTPLARLGPYHPDTVARLLDLPLLARPPASPFSRTLRGAYGS